MSSTNNRSLIGKVSPFLRNALMVLVGVTGPFMLYYGGDFPYKKIFLDSTYDLSVRYPFPSEKGWKVDVSMIVDGEKESFTKYIRVHKYIEFTARAFIGDIYAAYIIGHRLKNGDVVYIDLKTRTVNIFSKDKQTFRTYFREDMECPSCAQIKDFSISVSDYYGDADYVDTVNNLYDLSNYIEYLYVYRRGAIKELFGLYGKQSNVVAEYIGRRVLVVPKKVWMNIPHLADTVSGGKTVLSSGSMNEQVYRSLKDKFFSKTGCNYEPTQNGVWFRALYPNDGQSWSIDSRDYVRTLYKSRTEINSEQIARNNSDFLFRVNSRDYECPTSGSFSIYNPLTEEFYFYSRDTSIYYIPTALLD